MSENRALLEVTDLIKHYPVRAGVLRRRVGTVSGRQLWVTQLISPVATRAVAVAM